MLVTKAAPDFKTMAVMPDNTFKEISLSDFKGKKVVLFFILLSKPTNAIPKFVYFYRNDMKFIIRYWCTCS